MSSNARRFVLENMLLAGHPFAPSDNDFDVAKLPVIRGPGPRRAEVNFPGIKARLVIDLASTGTPNVRADKLYEVHYSLLSLAALSDYDDPRVFYTSRGVATDMGWSDSGPSLRRVRDAVEFLRAVTIEVEGEMDDPLIPGQRAHGTGGRRIITDYWSPSEEERKQGGRNLSCVIYNPSYLHSIKNDPTVQLDVELLSQIQGTLGKAFYRAASWLRATGRDSIELGELFERTGSVRSYRAGSHAKRFFGGAWDLMLRYRYFKSLPVSEKQKDGSWVVHFDWGEPVVLPRRGDALFRAITDAGVSSKMAEQMIQEDAHKARRIIQAQKAGALSRPYTTVAAQIVGLFKDPNWDVALHRDGAEQMDLILHGGRPRYPARAVAAAQAPAAADPRAVPWLEVVRWDSLEAGAPGGWDRFRREVLVPALGAAGETDPEQPLRIEAVRGRLQRAFERVGWASAVRALREGGLYLRAAEMKASYTAAMLEKLAGEARAPASAPRAEAVAAASAAAPAPHLEAGGPRPPPGWLTGGDVESAYLLSWLEDLERAPGRDVAKRALRLVEERATRGQAPESVAGILEQVRARAEAVLKAGA